MGTATFDVCVSDGTASDCETITVTVSAAGSDPVLVGAGDIASCTRTQDTDTAALVSGIPGNVFTIGDNAYETGTAAEFGCYNDTWGAFKARTRPTLGNHDFGNGATPGATPYFDYFNGVGNQTGPAGDRALGYYSYDIGSGASTWHVVVLNSECEPSTGYWLPGGCAAGSAQDLWLKNDLATAPTNNIIAMWHKPRWSSSGGLTHMQQLWQDLYDGGVDIVLGGHLHNYERFAPMNASGAADPSFGVREFVVGTGGRRPDRLRHDPADERGAQLEHLRGDEAHAARVELRLAVHPDRRPDVHGLGDRIRACRAGQRPDVPTIPVTDQHRREAAVQGLAVRRNVVGGAAVHDRVTGGHVDLASQPRQHVEQRPPDLEQHRRPGGREVVGDVTHVLLHGPSPSSVSIAVRRPGNTYKPWTSVRRRPRLACRAARSRRSISTPRVGCGSRPRTVANLIVVLQRRSVHRASRAQSRSRTTSPTTTSGSSRRCRTDTIGVLWSNQNTQRFGFKVHIDGPARRDLVRRRGAGVGLGRERRRSAWPTTT